MKTATICAAILLVTAVTIALGEEALPEIGLPAGSQSVLRICPVPAPERRIGAGQNEFYGPTYYYPSYHNYYEGLNPTYYPFYHPRLWPNYKSKPMYIQRPQCGPCPSRAHYWDDYDNWVRGGRYEEHQ